MNRWGVFVLGLWCGVLAESRLGAEVTARGMNHFTVVQTVEIACTAEAAWAAFTGDISGWWDHSFSGAPVRLEIEPFPGGKFIEIFDAAGNGAIHAEVTFVRAPRQLNFSGPLPFNGKAISMHHIVLITPVAGAGDADGVGEAEGAPRVQVSVTVNGFGKLEPGWIDGVDNVWRRFLVDRLKPYIEAPESLAVNAEG